jgi:hypothetical protein
MKIYSEKIGPSAVHELPLERQQCKPTFLPNPILFCDLKSHAKCQNPMITPSGRNVTRQKKREEKKKLGVLAPGSTHAGPSAQPPIDISGNFSGAGVCRVTFKSYQKN